MSYYNLLRKTHEDEIIPDPPVVPTWSLEIGINLYQAASASPQAVYSNMDKNRGSFGLITDPSRAGVVYPALDPVDRYPLEDFAMVLPDMLTSASAQTLHCRLMGTATIAVTTPGWTVANIATEGSAPNINTRFDLFIAPGTSGAVGGTLQFTNTRRLSTDVTNTGCRGIYVRYPGIALDEPKHLMPYMDALLAPISHIRFMHPLDAWTNIATRTPADRATPTRKPYWPGWETPQTISIEECVEICNQYGKNGWFPTPVAADDDLMEVFATVVRDNLAPGKWALFELGNEIWNQTAYNALSWSVTRAMDMVNGFVNAYIATKVCAFVSRTGGIATGEFIAPDGHGCAPGDIVWAGYISGANAGNPASAPAGNKTILTTPTPFICTWAETGLPDYPKVRAKTGGQWRQGRLLVSATRAAGVMTIVFGQDHGVTAGHQFRVLTISGLANGVFHTVASTPTPRSITAPCTGVDGPVIFTGSSSVVFDFTSELNSFDNVVDLVTLARRWYAKRTKEYSDIIAGVFGGEFGSRAKVGLFNQPTAAMDQDDQTNYLVRTYGPLKNYIQVIGKGSYTQLNASAWPAEGGANLRDVTTYDGNTPPSMENYADTWMITATHIKDGTGNNVGGYDAHAVVARLNDVELWNYEFGPDATASNGDNIAGVDGAAAGLQKLATLHDFIFQPSFEQHLETLEDAGFQKITYFNSGTCKVGNTSAAQSWGWVRDFTTPELSPRWTALNNKVGAPRTGPKRNLLDTVNPVTIDGRAIVNVYPYPTYSGAYPSAVSGSNARQTWLITAPEAGDWEFEPTFTATGSTRNIIVQVNGVSLSPNYSIPVGTTTFPARTISLTRGHNVIRTIPGTANPGTAVTCVGFLFTPVP